MESENKIFSRHARRRIKLYGLSESIIENILQKSSLAYGKHEIVHMVKGQKFPIKIVVSVEDDTIFVITSYPLKKRRKL